MTSHRPCRSIRFLTATSLLLGLSTAYAAPEEDDMMSFLQSNGVGQVIQNIDPTELASNLRNKAAGMIETALDYLGVPYRYGGTTTSGFDCSGFTRYVFSKTLGLEIPRTAAEQARYSGFLQVSRSDLQPGDLVFFNTMRRSFSHVGIYVGNGKFVHSPRSGSVVRVDSISNSYWSARFEGARRAGSGMKTAALPDEIAQFANQ